MKSRAVTVSISEYVASHGRQPRGRGSFAFEIGSASPEFFSGSYSEARAQACRVARARNVRVIRVCP